MSVRPESQADAGAIGAVTRAAFAGIAHSSGTEAAIVAALRAAGVLAVSLVAEERGEALGHVAFSPITINGADIGWFGLGPLSVLPARQRGGIGAALVRAGLLRLRSLGAHGCVVLGDPVYYSRFGFAADPRLHYPQAPAEYFQALVLAGEMPSGIVAYHAAFGAA